MTSSDSLREIAVSMVGEDLPIRLTAPDGKTIGRPGAPTGLRFHNDDAIRHLVRNPGELGFARAYVSGALDIEGSIWDIVSLKQRLPDVKLQPAMVTKLAKVLGPAVLHAPPIPPEEVQSGSSWRAHSRRRDAESISHHYDVGNDFYRLILGPSWTYSCAVFEDERDALEQAQANKYELISRKLALRPGMRILDVGCGWGGMVLHAAKNHGVDAVGVTISNEQAAKARERVAVAGLEDRIQIRVQDYRDLGGERFDAISSIGMFEHVGLDHLRDYFLILGELLTDEGRLLNHQIGRRPDPRPRSRLRHERARVHPRGFVHRYVFPDGELHEVGDLIGAIQRTGFEVRHMESLREHYALTLRHWVANLERHWDEAVDMVGPGRVRVWHLYMAASSEMFRSGEIQIHQVLATKTPADTGVSGMPWRHSWDADLAGPAIDLRSVPTTPGPHEPAGTLNQRLES